MSQIREYEQLHFFLDESGGFRNQDINLVGGMIVLGPYDSQADEALLQILRDCVHQCHGLFPEDLHFFKTKLSPDQRKSLCERIAARLASWQGDQREIFGIAICHRCDVFRLGSNLLAEREYDNRYLQMLYALIEFACFVYPRIRAKLRPTAEVRVYVGQRHFPVPDSPENKQLLSQLGYEFFPNSLKPGQLLVKAITRRELRGLLRAGIRHSWPNTQLCFQEIGVLRISYDLSKPPTQPAGLYLADLELGCLRGQLQGIRHPIRFLPTLAVLDYGPTLHQLARMQAALEEGSLASFFERSKDFHVRRRQPRCDETQPNDPIAETLAAQTCQAAQLVKKDPQPLLDFLKSVSQLVDKPGYAQVGADLADFTVGILNQASQAMPEAEIFALQVHLSAANHLGERHLADHLWEQYFQREEQLKELGLRGLELMAEMRNRRAISRLDQFCFDEAKIVLGYILGYVEHGLESLARMFNVSAAQLPMRLIGTLYGTLGQIYALQSEPDRPRAKECFRKALGFFTAPEDRQRQWGYLGHLACDQGEQGRTLWLEVCAELPELTARWPVTEEGKQYVLALQIKGLYVFGTLADILAFLLEWQKTDPIRAYSPSSRQLHPFGLIYQGLGLLCERAWRETKDMSYAQQARKWYEQAAKHMEQGGPVLKVLSRIAHLRRLLLESELPDLQKKASQRLREVFLGLHGYLAEHFGNAAWGERPDGRADGHFGRLDPGPSHSWRERAQALLRAIRFNYW